MSKLVFNISRIAILLGIAAATCSTSPAFARDAFFSSVSSTSISASSAKPAKKVSYLQKVKNFFKALWKRIQDEAVEIILGILLAFLFPPLAILVVGLMRRRDDWVLHFILNIVIFLLAWVILFVSCGFGVWITLLFLVGCFVHALWYVLARK